MSWYFYAWLIASLAMMWIPLVTGYLERRRIRGEASPTQWLSERKDVAMSLVSTTVVAAGAVLAWASTQQQIIEGRKQHRLEYLRQYVTQVETARIWLKHLSSGPRLVLVSTDMEPFKSQQATDQKDYVALLNAMPPMPFYKGLRPAERRDQIIDALKDFSRVDALKSSDREAKDKAASAVRSLDSWWEDFSRVSEIEEASRRELEKLEEEIEPRPRSIFDR